MRHIVSMHVNILFYMYWPFNPFLQYPETCILSEIKFISFSLSRYTFNCNRLRAFSLRTLNQICYHDTRRTAQTVLKSMAIPCLSFRLESHFPSTHAQSIELTQRRWYSHFGRIIFFILTVLIFSCSFKSLQAPLYVSVHITTLVSLIFTNASYTAPNKSCFFDE